VIKLESDQGVPFFNPFLIPFFYESYWWAEIDMSLWRGLRVPSRSEESIGATGAISTRACLFLRIMIIVNRYSRKE
jgi:hypothetical protein